MWKATAGVQLNISNDAEDDDWETDPDFVNDVSEQEQRWGSKTIEGSGRTAGAINMQQLREETEKADADIKKKQLEEINPGYGYGGKFGIQTDRMDKSAVGHDYIGKVEKHASQKDYSEGFGGKFGVQKDRIDKSAEGWDYKETVEKHSSQKDYVTGFGGKFGIQSDRIDKSAVGWDYIEKVEKHESQKDYAKGFGGKFGIQEDRKDKSAVGWDYIEAPKKHESQIDHKVGFGGKFGVQSDRMDKSAVGFDDHQNERIGTNYTKVKPDIGGAKPSNLRSKFENLAKVADEEDKQKAAEQKRLREEKDRSDREEASKRQIFETTGTAHTETTTTTTINRKLEKIDTGRKGGIGNAINAFNLQSSTHEQHQQQQQQHQQQQQQQQQPRKEPIKLPKEEAKVVIQPDVIPVMMEPEIDTTPQTIAQKTVSQLAKVTEEYENIFAPPKEFSQQEQQPQQQQPQEPEKDPIYQNQDLSEYIEDTGIKAIALYDYQAAADDEISFDPDDIISHIEMIDEGWWRGLCKNRYGLFPANYVQLQEQQQA